MSGQLRYSFKKEISQFFRTFVFLGMALAIFGFAIANPLMAKFSGILFREMDKMSAPTQAAQISVSVPEEGEGLLGGIGIGEMADFYNNGAMMFATSLVSFASYSLLIVMLVMRSTSGGEQKKRAMIVPLCSGLQNKNYLIPKFIIYPLSSFAMTFLGGLLSGGLCNALFDNGKIGFGMIEIGSLLMAIYIMFVITVYMSLGLCTSRPGIMTGAVFVGQMILQSFLEGIRLEGYQPFALVTAVNRMFASENYLSENTANILVSAGLALVISVLMYFLALGVLNAKRIDNQEEDKPAF